MFQINIFGVVRPQFRILKNMPKHEFGCGCTTSNISVHK